MLELREVARRAMNWRDAAQVEADGAGVVTDPAGFVGRVHTRMMLAGDVERDRLQKCWGVTRRSGKGKTRGKRCASQLCVAANIGPPNDQFSRDTAQKSRERQKRSFPWPSLQSAATMPGMADWRQIQARIRKAKNSADAPTKLHELYQRTRDAMVAWEIGVVEEKAERSDEAVKWYTIAVERFRRADWKKKAEEALTRLGAPLPEPGAKPSAEPAFEARAAKTDSFAHSAGDDSENLVRGGGVDAGGDSEAPEIRLALGEIADDDSEDSDDETSTTAEGAGAVGVETDATKKKRRRGRRGGRGRRRKGAPAAPGLPSQSFADAGAPAAAADPTALENRPSPQTRPQSQHSQAGHARAQGARPDNARPANTRSSSGRNESYGRTASSLNAREEAEPRLQLELPEPMLPSERTAHGRAGDPALASRMAKLDSMLRRLVSSPLHKLDDSDSAPAGPGVFLLSDSDQITSYYVEACQTLRVGLGNLARGSGRSTTKAPRQGRPVTDSGLKTKLAEHLGIGEAKVSQYLKDHCVVRWIQLDDDAPHLAHFAISILRTPLNLD
jgi:hypothetical protein